jgi:predicted TIM-barrel fold metal-dependent hydrolase
VPVIDADCHVIESERTWEYLDEGDAKYRPLKIKSQADLGNRLGDECWIVDGRLIRRGAPGLVTTTQESRELIGVEARLSHMDKLGVDVQVLYPTLWLRPVTDEPSIEIALCKSYNRWLADIWSQSEGRLRWAAVLPLLTMPEALRELESAKQHGACAVFVRGFEADRHLGDPYLYPLYEAAEALDLPICAHAGNSSFFIEDFFRRWSGLSVFKFPVLDGFLSLIQANVPAQFPKLRFGFVEVASQWVPYAIHFLMGRRSRNLDLQDLLAKSRFYVACQTDDDIPYVLKYAGKHNLVIGSDYGHEDASSEIEALRHLRDFEELDGETVDRILDDNPSALYGLSREA